MKFADRLKLFPASGDGGGDDDDLPQHCLLLPILVAREEVASPILDEATLEAHVAQKRATKTGAVVDTFASRSIVDHRVLAAIGLTADARGLCRLRLLPEPGVSIALEVRAANFARPYRVRLGMDVLRHGRLSLDGPTGEFILEF